MKLKILYSDIFEPVDWLKITQKIKRVLDVLGSTIGLILTLPIMVVIAVTIKATSKGPVFFKQKRIGFLGEKFVFYKFRTMYNGCDEEKHKKYITRLISGEIQKNKKNDKEDVFKIQNDCRITPIGKFLRKTSLDELPQFFNVIKGEMSLVGPRPPIPYEVRNYKNWHLRRILEVKPGITGIWQVDGRSRTTFEEMVRMDIMYLNKLSIWLDIKILVKTCWVVLTGKGAY
jgi:exopolysaccharide biosynthesis polyprenyl glycosylphosphotransferase